MSSNAITAAIAAARAVFHGDYVSVSRVADTLLDLRAMAAGDPALIARIDETLAAIPGRSVAPNTWWAEALDAIEASGCEDGAPLDTVAVSPI